MKNIVIKHAVIKKMYDSGVSPIEELKDITLECLQLLSVVERYDYGYVGTKHYFCYFSEKYSRPVATNLFILEPQEFVFLWDRLFSGIDEINHSCSLDEISIDRVIYTAIMSFAICFDIWKSESRKTPGTHFEILLGSTLDLFLRGFARSKHIVLPELDKLSTDIAFSNEGITLVFPAKTTTRERIVQPYAHQRILDSLSPGKYKSILLCVSETQRDNKNTKVNDICVPGTIKLYQAHMSNISGIYYLDPPQRYLQDDILELVKVSTIGHLLKYDLLPLSLNRA